MIDFFECLAHSFSDVVIGVSVSGMIKLWSLNDLEKKVFFHLFFGLHFASKGFLSEF